MGQRIVLADRLARLARGPTRRQTLTLLRAVVAAVAVLCLSADGAGPLAPRLASSSAEAATPSVEIVSYRELLGTGSDIEAAVGGGVVGPHSSGYLFRIRCSFADSASFSLTHTNPAFTVSPNYESIQCGSWYEVHGGFAPPAPGLYYDEVTFTIAGQVFQKQLIGNAVPVVSPPSWIVDLDVGAGGYLASRAVYDDARDLVYVSASGIDSVLVGHLSIVLPMDER